MLLLPVLHLLVNRLNRSVSASVIDWFFGPVLCSSRSKRASAAMNGVGREEELFVVPQHIRAAMSSLMRLAAASLRAGGRPCEACGLGPFHAIGQAPSALAHSRWLGRGARSAISRPQGPCGRPQARQGRGHRTPDGVRNTKTPFPSHQNACLHAPWPLCGATSTTRINRLAWLIRAARAD